MQVPPLPIPLPIASPVALPVSLPIPLPIPFPIALPLDFPIALPITFCRLPFADYLLPITPAVVVDAFSGSRCALPAVACGTFRSS
jgi:hypothetical protein